MLSAIYSLSFFNLGLVSWPVPKFIQNTRPFLQFYYISVFDNLHFSIFNNFIELALLMII